MKECSTELIIRWGRQPAGQHKQTEVQHDMNNFNCAFSKCWFRNFDLVLARDRDWPALWCHGLEWLPTREKHLPYRSTIFASIITVLITTYVEYLKYIFLCQTKQLNVVNFRLYFIETTVATIFFSGLADWLKKVAWISSPFTFLNVSGTANPLIKMLASLISGLAICAHLCLDSWTCRGTWWRRGRLCSQIRI